MEAKKLVSLILSFILFSSLVSIAENIEIAPLISLDRLEPTYDQEEKDDLNANENEIKVNIREISFLASIFHNLSFFVF